MKMVNCNKLFYHYVHGKRWCPITDKLILTNGDSLYYNFIFTIYGGPASFYKHICCITNDVLYNILDEDNYFDEDD